MGLSACVCKSLRNTSWGVGAKERKKEGVGGEGGWDRCRNWHAAASLSCMGFSLLEFAFDQSATLFRVFLGIYPAVGITLGFFPKLASARDSSEEFTHTLTADSTLMRAAGSQQFTLVHTAPRSNYRLVHPTSSQQQHWVWRVWGRFPLWSVCLDLGVWKWKPSKQFFPISLSGSSLPKSCRRKKNMSFRLCEENQLVTSGDASALMAQTGSPVLTWAS